MAMELMTGYLGFNEGSCRILSVRSFKGQQVGDDNQYDNKYSHKLQEKKQESLAILVIEPEIYCQRLIPLDESCIIRVSCNIGARADSGKKRVLYIEFLREGNIDVIGTFEGYLKVIITKGRDIRHGIISSFKC
jgi:hypothetical protein